LNDSYVQFFLRLSMIPPIICISETDNPFSRARWLSSACHGSCLLEVRRPWQPSMCRRRLAQHHAPSSQLVARSYIVKENACNQATDRALRSVAPTPCALLPYNVSVDFLFPCAVRSILATSNASGSKEYRPCRVLYTVHLPFWPAAWGVTCEAKTSYVYMLHIFFHASRSYGLYEVAELEYLKPGCTQGSQTDKT
jgi:hypothetical protein